MRLIDRERPEGASPHTFTMEDWEMIEQCPYFWARKFDMSRDSEVIEKVYNTWRSQGEATGDWLSDQGNKTQDETRSEKDKLAEYRK